MITGEAGRTLDLKLTSMYVICSSTWPDADIPGGYASTCLDVEIFPDSIPEPPPRPMAPPGRSTLVEFDFGKFQPGDVVTLQIENHGGNSDQKID